MPHGIETLIAESTEVIAGVEVGAAGDSKHGEWLTCLV